MQARRIWKPLLLTSFVCTMGIAYYAQNAPINLPIHIDKESGELQIGEVHAPVIDELFLFDGETATPARPDLVVQDDFEVRGFTGRYPVPLGVSIRYGVSGHFWGIYKNTVFEIASIKDVGRKHISFWSLKSPNLETLADIHINLLGKQSVFISDKYVVFTDKNRQVVKSGQFVSLVFGSEVRTKGILMVHRAGKLLKPIESTESENIVYPIVKAKSTVDLVEWKVIGKKGQTLLRGTLAFPMLGAEPNLVEYYINVSNGEEVALQARQKSKIAFTSYRDLNYEVYVMNADGTEQTNSTRHPAMDGAPSWSPDGQKIAFASTRDGNLEIYVMIADGSRQQRLTKNPASDNSPKWSLNGKNIAFASERDGNSEIYIMDAEGVQQKRLTNNSAFDATPSWSPDGKRIAFNSDRDGNLEIYVMNADGSQQKRLTNNIADDGDPSWSPDGKKIAFSSDRDGNPEVYVMNANGRDQRRLTKNTAIDGAPSWSPDGEKIVFMSYRDGNDEIYVMNADGTKQTNLSENRSIDSYPSWSSFIRTDESNRKNNKK